MQIVHSINELQTIIRRQKQQGKLVGFVPTMGNLHQGHIQLVDMALQQSDFVVCSIFVNPLQFGEGEDFEQYPRTLNEDAQQLEAVGCHLLFAPSVDEMYPEAQTKVVSQVVVPDISDILEGASRPGHFIGVATVVAKLFNMVQPDKAVFGEKDYQQLQVIKRFVKDLCFPIEIISHPIVREASGLAMSSRNGYLSETQKQTAALIHETLLNIGHLLQQGRTDYADIEQMASRQLDEQGFNTDYIQIRCIDLSAPKQTDDSLVILLAAYLGNTRLIDNKVIDLETGQ